MDKKEINTVLDSIPPGTSLASRSIQRRIAAQRGEPAPAFDDSVPSDPWARALKAEGNSLWTSAQAAYDRGAKSLAAIPTRGLPDDAFAAPVVDLRPELIRVILGAIDIHREKWTSAILADAILARFSKAVSPICKTALLCEFGDCENCEHDEECHDEAKS